MLTGETVCGFRDSAYLYYPLFRWIDAQWAAGEIPLWNHYDQFGVPLVADGSTTVFYPGKLIFWVRWLSFPSRYGIYLASHVLLAAITCYWLARRVGCDKAGAAVAGISYGFGGSVLFQVCNVIYLVGAAWLPLAIGCIWLMIRHSSAVWAIAGGVVCALMILGGDPQLVYHVGLIGLGTIFGSFLRARRIRKREIGRGEAPLVVLFSNLTRLLWLVGVTAILSAIQLLPAMEWTEGSERARFKRPRNVFEWVRGADEMYKLKGVEDDWRSMIEAPIPGTHHDHLHQFSQPPWTVLEMGIPNFSGRAFPLNQRWASVLPGADRMWVPSLYLGCFSTLVALSAIRLWGKRRRQVWLSRFTLFFAIASFGWYGAVWLVGEFVDLSASQLGPQVGGLYWLMVTLLPKYVMFRYPAKLFVIAALGMSLLAGLGLERLLRQPGKLKRILMSAAGLCLVALAVTVLVETHLEPLWHRVPADAMFGPFEVETATANLRRCGWHMLIVLLAILLPTILLELIAKRGSSKSPLAPRKTRRLRSGLSLVISLVVLCDLLSANSWLTADVDAFVFSKRPIGQPQTEAMANPIDGLRFYEPESSPHSLAQVIQFQQRAMLPKHHLLVPIRNELSFSSIARPIAGIQAGLVGRAFASVCDGRREGVLTFANVKQTSPSGVANVVEQGNHFYRIEVETNMPGYLCVQTLNVPGWQATVRTEGRDSTELVEIVPWLGSLQAIPIEQGKCTVELVYEPPAFWRGAWISGLGWGILLVLSGIQFIRQRKSVGS